MKIKRYQHVLLVLLVGLGAGAIRAQEPVAVCEADRQGYTQAVNSNKRAAQSKVVKMMVSDVGQKREEKYPQTTQ